MPAVSQFSETLQKDSSLVTAVYNASIPTDLADKMGLTQPSVVQGELEE